MAFIAPDTVPMSADLTNPLATDPWDPAQAARPTPVKQGYRSRSWSAHLCRGPARSLPLLRPLSTAPVTV